METAIKSVRVALADDHPVVLAGIAALIATLQDLDLVGTATDADMAVALVVRTQPQVVVLDVTMPGNDGHDLVIRCLNACATVKVLILTTHEDSDVARAHFRDGAMGYLLKRSAVAELARAIMVVADGGLYIDPAIAGSFIGRVDAVQHPGGMLLSKREEAVMQMVAKGLSSKETAHQLGLSIKTVETYRARAAKKIGARSRADIVRYGIQNGWLSK